MLGKILIIALLVLGAVVGYEYYIGNIQVHTSTNNGATVSKTTASQTTVVNTIHYFNFSASITVYSNGTANYIYPVNLPSNGNVTITLASNSTFHVKIYDNNSLLSQYSGIEYHKSFQGGGKLELVFYNFTGNLNISVDEVY